ncbi:MAG: 30S ribosome-binding factor RbfA [Candidatus Abyssobacteria bacterium SURF_5]|uniref:Ribosome-binding factor A n=1 Tax=Abyssobacteria bacterium (strain SURF_5) TaxID=2093360 RepID=A0A3A4NUV2_ABYX5|nr:MAG: 30S ribosome-binding factor RbfA [Candidatus Abyssubacteria bacterium SURF_5]
MENRQKRLSELLKHEISDLILREIKDPRIGFVSITDVEVSSDLRHAKVFISVLGTESERKSTIAGLRSALGFMRREIGSRLRLKYVPELSVLYDNSIEHGSHILELIDSVVEKKTEPADEE